MDIQILIERLEDMKHTADCVCVDCTNINHTIRILEKIDVDKIDKHFIKLPRILCQAIVDYISEDI